MDMYLSTGGTSHWAELKVNECLFTIMIKRKYYPSLKWCIHYFLILLILRPLIIRTFINTMCFTYFVPLRNQISSRGNGGSGSPNLSRIERHSVYQIGDGEDLVNCFRTWCSSTQRPLPQYMVKGVEIFRSMEMLQDSPFDKSNFNVKPGDCSKIRFQTSGIVEIVWVLYP